MAILTQGNGILSKGYGKDEPTASNAGIKRSTAGATVMAAVLGILTVFNGPFDAAFGNSSGPWLKFAVFGIILVVWGAIMVADILSRKAGIPREAEPTEPTEAELHRFVVQQFLADQRTGNGAPKQPAGRETGA